MTEIPRFEYKPEGDIVDHKKGHIYKVSNIIRTEDSMTFHRLDGGDYREIVRFLNGQKQFKKKG